MVNKINLVRGVGRFDNVSSGSQIQFSKLTLIYAENATGKSTLSAILRSLASGRPELVSERARLGAIHTPHIVIDVGTPTPVVFQNGSWNRTFADIAVFDDHFVTDNVFAGMEVASLQRQNLHELIVGSQGIALANAYQKEVDRIEQHNRELSVRQSAIPADKRGPLDVEQFVLLEKVAGIEQQIAEAEKHIAAARNASLIATTSLLIPLSLPRIDLEQIHSLLNKHLPDVEADALRRVQMHLAKLGRGAEGWISEGLNFASATGEAACHCPFCGQDLHASTLIETYRVYFGDAYNALKVDIAAAGKSFGAKHGGDAAAAFERDVRTNVEKNEFWRRYCDIPPIELDTVRISQSWKEAREGLLSILRAKFLNPLDQHVVPDKIVKAIAVHNANANAVIDISDVIRIANEQIQIAKERAKDSNLHSLERDLTTLRAVAARFEPPIAALCDAYIAEKNAKTATERRRQVARDALDKHRNAAFPAYGVAINGFLASFNANFRLGPIDPVNNRSGSSANYKLEIDGHTVPLSSAPGTPNFRNTLSAGDRNTLALALFFAMLSADPNRNNKIVVFDDPMTSLDEHRTLHTIQQLNRLVPDVAGVIIMSHSKPFLLGVWEKCQQVSKTAIEVRRLNGGSTLAEWNVSDALVTEHDRRYLRAVEYLQNADPTLQRPVAESLRPMLEMYCRIAYSKEFPSGSLIGKFHNQCMTRIGTPSEIMPKSHLDELRDLLDFGNRYHHEANSAFATETINDTELVDFTRRTLHFMKRH